MSDGVLEGRTALVTGGGTGIGKGCAAGLADAGARVTICGPDVAVLEAAVADLRAEGPDRQLASVVCDVTDESQVSAAVDVAADGAGLGAVVANAGTGLPGSLLHLTEEHWMVPLGVNVLGTAFTIKHAALNMKDHGGGQIITISSIASSRPARFMGAYGVSKAAVDELTRTAAAELGRLGIRVNAIRPGAIQTDALLGASTEANAELMERETVLGRLGEPSDIARAVVYLASDLSEWVTGQVISVCGGFSLIPPSIDTEHLARAIFTDQMDADFGPTAPG